MFLAAITAFAQNADIMVCYNALSPNMKKKDAKVTKQYILLTNTTESKFYSPKTEYIDSINSTPEGKAIYQEMAKNAIFGGKMNQMPRKDGKYYVVKSFPNNILRYYDSVGLDKLYYEETPGEWNWAIGADTKEILGYQCIMAETDYHGRKWTVWFAPEIPLHNGPWKFDGLPGLILEATSADGQYSFTATGIQQTHKLITPVYLSEEYDKTTRQSFLKEQRHFMDNPVSRLNAQTGGGILKVTDKNGKDITRSLYLPRKTVDLIETDY